MIEMLMRQLGMGDIDLSNLGESAKNAGEMISGFDARLKRIEITLDQIAAKLGVVQPVEIDGTAMASEDTTA